MKTQFRALASLLLFLARCFARCLYLYSCMDFPVPSYRLRGPSLFIFSFDYRNDNTSEQNYYDILTDFLAYEEIYENGLVGKGARQNGINSPSQLPFIH